MLKSFAFLLTVLVFQKSFQVQSFSPILLTSHSSTKSIVCSLKKDDGDDTGTFQERLDKFLDTQFFDPDKVLAQNEEQEVIGTDLEENGTEENRETNLSNRNPIALWFAKLVKNDYETAEALYAASFISFMVILGQELLRYQLNGDNYVPFQRGHGGFGNKFDWY